MTTPTPQYKRQEIPRLLASLSERDLRILKHLVEHKFLTTNHLKRLEFADHRTDQAGTRACTRVLTRLWHRRLIFRLERPVGGIRGGSGAYVWGLDEAGDRAARAHLSLARSSRKRSYEPSYLFLAHTLAVAELRTLITEASRRGTFELVTLETEPTCWRTFTGRNGTPETLKPDLFVVTATDDYEDHAFLEVDRGTESLAVLLTKCRIYQRYFNSGREQAATGLFPQVVWLISDTDRQRRLQAALTDDALLLADLFHVLAPHDYVSSMTSLNTPTDEAELAQ